jgi:hypothetical protein
MTRLIATWAAAAPGQGEADIDRFIQEVAEIQRLQSLENFAPFTSYLNADLLRAAEFIR